MPQPKILLTRLDDIGRSLKSTEQALALLGLGSVGLETDRLDQYSDLDFFAIVKPRTKQRFLEQLDWLSNISEISYSVRNTDDGYKVLYRDGVFCEFAIFEPQELENITFAPGRIVWQDASFDASICQPSSEHASAPKANTNIEWQLGEALTNLFVGMGRDCRGEKLSAMRFIQVYSLDRVIDLINLQSQATEVNRDPFMTDRRLEARYPDLSEQLASFAQGYGHNADSALSQLEFLSQHFSVNNEMSAAIKNLCRQSSK